MSSRNPADLEDDLRSIEFSGDPERLADLREEARTTVDRQTRILRDIDTKASKILRINILLLGILVSGISIAAQTGPEGSLASNVGPFVTIYSKLGIASLVLSTAFAGMTYTASELDVGLSRENFRAVLASELPDDDIEELLLKNYVVRINFNRSTNVRNIPLIQLTICFALAAVVLLMLGVYAAIVGPVPSWLLLAAGALLGLVVVVAGLPRQLPRAIRDIRAWN